MNTVKVHFWLEAISLIFIGMKQNKLSFGELVNGELTKSHVFLFYLHDNQAQMMGFMVSSQKGNTVYLRVKMVLYS